MHINNRKSKILLPNLYWLVFILVNDIGCAIFKIAAVPDIQPRGGSGTRYR